MKQISSPENKLIKRLSKLKQKKYRQLTGLYLIEGFHLFQEALVAHLHFKYVLATQTAYSRAKAETDFSLQQANLILINQAIARHLSATKNSQDIFMVLPINQSQSFSFKIGKWALLDNLADPGNVGTIIRTADAAGFTGVVLSKGCVDLYNPKTQRAMQGSQFHLRLLKADLKEVISSFRLHDLPVYASVLNSHAKKLATFSKLPSFGLIIGNEAHGVRSSLIKMSDAQLYIPIKGQAESLNAAVAAGIMIYHFA